LLSRNEARLEALYDEIVVAGGKEPAILAMDLAKATHDDYVTLAGSLGEAIPKLDGLLHNASLLGDRKPIAQTRAASWHDVMQVNVNAGFMLTQTLLPLLDQSPSAVRWFLRARVWAERDAPTGGAMRYQSLRPRDLCKCSQMSSVRQATFVSTA
jgi:NAD(P)-dependent dehydrogenase (short-subunit alcohol dehydrogenase family)